MKDTNGKTITEEEFMKDMGHGVERTQENWKEEFRKRFVAFGYTHPGIEDFISTLLAEARSDSYTNGYIDGYDEGKKIVLLQVESKLPKPVKNLTGKVWDEYAEGQNKIINKVSTILNNLKVK